MHKANRLGTKNGIGFYVYDETKKGGFKADCGRYPGQDRSVKGTLFSPERLVFQMINEAAYCLEENVASPSDIDLAMLAGTGFPQDKGGPLHLADGIGVDVVLEKLKEFSMTLGPRFLARANFEAHGFGEIIWGKRLRKVSLTTNSGGGYGSVLECGGG